MVTCSIVCVAAPGAVFTLRHHAHTRINDCDVDVAVSASSRILSRRARHVNTRDIHTRWRSQVVVAVARVDFDSEQLISLSKASGATKCL